MLDGAWKRVEGTLGSLFPKQDAHDTVTFFELSHVFLMHPSSQFVSRVLTMRQDFSRQTRIISSRDVFQNCALRVTRNLRICRDGSDARPMLEG